jgi:transposase-like protein
MAFVMEVILYCSPLRHGASELSILWLTPKEVSMHRRTWDTQTQAMIVIEGLKGTPVAELCTKHQISQAQYYQWRDQFLAHAPKAFEGHEPNHQEARLEQENVPVKKLVGALLLALKKSDEVLG